MFGRLLTAMVTPFDADLRLDLRRVPALVDHLVETGTTALVVCGTTGEWPTLTPVERMQLFEAAVAAAANRVPVIAGTGLFSTAETVAFTRDVSALGVNGFSVVAPYYNKPSQDGLFRHYARVAEATDKPIMVYNIPSRTGVNIAHRTMVRIAEIENVVGVKEASGDLTQIAWILRDAPPGFLVYSGDDKYALPVMAMGGEGVVSVAAHVVGGSLRRLTEAVAVADMETARLEHLRLLPLFEELFKTTNPVLVKAALAMMGLPVGGVREPLVDATAVEKRELRRVLGNVIKLPAVH